LQPGLGSTEQAEDRQASLAADEIPQGGVIALPA
jgi:hypothetical protein